MGASPHNGAWDAPYETMAHACLACSVVRLGGLMNPDSLEFYDPKMSADIFLLETRRQLFGEGNQHADQRLPGRAQHNNAGRWFRREAQDVAEVEIERDEASLFPSADIVNRLIGYAVKFLIVNGQSIMTGLA